MPSTLKTRLDQRRKQLRWTQEQLAAEAGVPYETVKNILGKNRSRNPRGVALTRLARAVDRAEAWLLGETDEERAFGTAQPTETSDFLPIRFRTAAGVWRERDDDAQEFLGEGPKPPPDAFSRFPQWWEIVEGDSINKIYPPGALILVIDAIALGYRPRDDDLVVIERRRNGTKERTVKQVRVRGKRLIVHGASTNKKYNTELDVTEGLVDGDEVEIVGFVNGAFIQSRR